MSPEDPETRVEQQRFLGSMTPASFYSKSPYSPMAPPPHGPSLLRHESSLAVPTATLGGSASFAVVIRSPANRLPGPILARPPTSIKKRGRLFKNSQATPVQSISKKKGRPFKTPEAAAAAARGDSTHQIPKKRGRPSKYPQAVEDIEPVEPPEPRFIPFICEWKSCPAELHNLDTLRAHLITVHLEKQSAAGRLTCMWKKCCQGHIELIGDMSSNLSYKSMDFRTKEEWWDHVKLHLGHIARWQGDGPKTELSFTKKPPPALSYSFLHGGPEGQATPSVRNQPVEGGRAKDNNLARFRKKRDGLYVIYEPVENPELYMTVEGGNGKHGEVFKDE